MNSVKYNVFELFFKRDNEKRSMLLLSEDAVKREKAKLRRRHRKYLGHRQITVVEYQTPTVDNVKNVKMAETD